MARKKNNSGAELPDLSAIHYEPLKKANSPEYENFYRELSGCGDAGILLHRKRKKKPDGYTVVRKEDVREVRQATLVSMQNPEFRYHLLAGSGQKRHMRSFVITLKGGGENSAFTTHNGEEFILVQKGSVRIYLGDNEETLLEGDSIYYRSSIPHRLENLSKDHSIILAVIYGM